MGKEKSERAVKGTPCVHYWMIASPSGSSMSLGTCKLCGERRDFLNSMNDSRWPRKRNSSLSV